MTDDCHINRPVGEGVSATEVENACGIAALLLLEEKHAYVYYVYGCKPSLEGGLHSSSYRSLAAPASCLLGSGMHFAWSRRSELPLVYIAVYIKYPFRISRSAFSPLPPQLLHPILCFLNMQMYKQHAAAAVKSLGPGFNVGIRYVAFHMCFMGV